MFSIGPLGIIIPAVTAGISAIQTAISAKRQRQNINIANQQNKELAKYQYDRQMEMYDKSLAYNTPVKQMERYLQAGLNPNLIYKQGDAGNSPNVLPQYQRPQLEANFRSPFNLPEILSTYVSMSEQLQELHNKRIQGAILDRELVKKGAEADNWGSYWFNKGMSEYYKSQGSRNKLGVDFADWYGDTGYKNRTMSGLYAQKGLSQIAQYNANVGAINARKILTDTQVENFVPLWFKMVTSGISSLGTLASGFTKFNFGKGGKYTPSKSNYPSYSRPSYNDWYQRQAMYNYGKNNFNY